jgi:hypothetical protein
MLPATSVGQEYSIKPVAEMKVKQLPPGPLYWTVETFPALSAAKAAAGPYALAVEVADKAWLLTLAAKGTATPGATKVAEVGPVPTVKASEYLLRINYATAPAGAKTAIHTHPGAESFYVLTGRLGQKTPHGESHADAGGTLTGHGADTPMQVFNGGTQNLQALVMFVTDAERPFSSPATLP